jgi:hypothetical protein
MAHRGGRAITCSLGVLAAIAVFCLLLAPLASASGHAHKARAKAKQSRVCKQKRKGRGSCKKRKGRQATAPPTPRSVTLTWDSSANIDLIVYDQSGHYAGPGSGGMVNGIPGAVHSADDSDGFGPETFDDPAGRRVGYLACYVSGPHAKVTLVDSGSGGGTYTATLGPTGSGAYTDGVGWGFLPIGVHC